MQKPRLIGCTAFTLALAVSLAAASSARADEPLSDPANPAGPARSPYQLKLAVDIPVLLSALALWTVPPLAIGSSAPGASCGTSTTPACDASALNPLDRLVVGTQMPWARTASNVLFAVPAVFLVGEFFDNGVRNWRSSLTDLFVVAETVAVSGALDEIVRRAFHRPRPYLYIPGAYPADRDNPEASFSFYSGHTSTMFAFAASLAYTYDRRHPHAWQRYLVWAGLLGAASAMPVFRVLAGDHFPTDVAVGAVVGTSLGILIPALHRTGDIIPGVKNLSFSPQVGAEGAMISVSGRF